MNFGSKEIQMNIIKLFLLPKVIVGIFLLTFIGCTSPDEAQDEIYPIDQTINGMDKHGTNVQYKVTYEIVGKTKISATDMSEIKLKTQWVVSDFLDQQLLIEDCLLKKDSLETMMSQEVITKNKTDFSHIGSFSIEETAIPESILELILERYPELKGKNIVAQ
jgi:hypothetical protein